MFRNHFKTALRNLSKHKSYASLNIVGLAVGVAACLLILQFVTDELSYDRHHQHSERLYRVDTRYHLGDKVHESGSTPSPLAWAMKGDFPEVEDAARIYKVPDVDKWLLTYEDNSYYEKIGAFADSNFFDLLTYEFLAGDKKTALNQPFSVVISDKVSEKLFGDENAVGKTIEINCSWGENDYRVTGVFDSRKYSSHLEASIYVSGMSANIGRRFYRLPEWGGNNLFFTYVRLKKGTDPQAFTAKIPDWLDGYAGERFKELGMHKEHYLTPISDVYLKAEGGNWFGGKGDITFIYILISVAAFILLIGCINFMNLATAKATLRAKEVGVRKVVGANRGMLIRQFLTEAFVYSGIAVVIAYVLAELTLPIFNQLTDKNLTINLLDFQLLGWMAGFIILITLAAGSYPALYLSSFSPIKIFKNNFGSQLSSQQIRKGLVVIQFIISIALIQGILVINEQMNYVRNKNLGFSPEAKLVMPVGTWDVFQNFEPLRNELLKNNQIHDVAGTSSYPGEINLESYFYFKEGQTPDEGFHAYSNTVTPEFLEMMDFELIKGRFFDRNRPADTLKTAVISEKAMLGMGFTENQVLGQKIYREWQGNRREFEVIGLIKDFHATSLRQEINGQIFDWNPQWIQNYFVASVETRNLPGLLKSMETTWTKINPGVPFEFNFMEDRLQQNYEADQRMSGLIFWGTLLAIFISCLGLFGLATFAAERREKEIGVRKVLGASVTNIVVMLSKDFLKLVILALIIAVPLSYFGMNEWLNDFAYRIDIQWWIFALAGVLAVGIAFLTIGFQSLKAATANPVESLRNE